MKLSKMEVYNSKIAVTFDELTSSEGGKAIMTRNTLNCLLRRHPELRMTRGGGLNCVCRVDYYGLRDSYRKAFESKYGDPRKLLAEEALRAELDLTMDERARKYYRDYQYELRGELKHLPEDVISELTLNASVLNRMIEITTRRTVMRNARCRRSSAKEILESAGEVYEKMRDAYGHTLPASLERLRTKMTAYKRDGYGVLISGKYGNQSATVITEEGGRYIIALKRSMVPVYTDRMILEEFNAQAERKDWKPLKSLRALTDWLHRPEIEPLWWDAAHGELTAHQRYSRKNQTELPKMRDSLWYGDGTKLNLYYKEYVDGKGWQVRTLQVYEVIDAYSEAMLGYCISETEDHKAQYTAYRMAVITAGHRPYELVHDNQGGHKKLETMGFLDRIPAKIHRTTAPNSGQSKTIESVFNRFQSQVLKQDWRFTGMNITAKKDSSRVNREFIAKNKDSLYTRDELLAAYAEARRKWNSMAHPETGIARMEMYLASSNPGTPAVTDEDMVEMFWLTTEKPVAYTDNGLLLTVNKKKYRYEVLEAPMKPDHEFLRKNWGRQYFVKYDPCDMSSVRLYTKDDNGLRFVRVAETYITIHRGMQEQQEGEQAFIRANIEANQQDRIIRQVAARTIEVEHGMSVEEQGLERASGLSRKEEAEIDRQVGKKTAAIRRTRHRENKETVMTPAAVGKIISQMVFDPTRRDEEENFDPLTSGSELRMVSKM